MGKRNMCKKIYIFAAYEAYISLDLHISLSPSPRRDAVVRVGWVHGVYGLD